MLALQLSYKNQQRKTRILWDEITFAVLEARARQLFRLWGKPILLFYKEEGQHNIILIDDEDVSTMCASFEISQKTIDIQIQLRSNSLVELGNPHIIQRCFVKELRRKYSKRDTFPKKKFKNDLWVIRKNLLAAKLTPSLTQQVIKRISQEIEMLFIDKMLENEGLSKKDGTNAQKVNDPFNASKSSIDFISKTNPSLFSKTEIVSQTFSKFPALKQLKEVSSEISYSRACEEPSEADDIWVDVEQVGPDASNKNCSLCKKNLSYSIRFKCTTCEEFFVCEMCAREELCFTEHNLEPFFEAQTFQQNLENFQLVLSKVKIKVLRKVWDCIENVKKKHTT